MRIGVSDPGSIGTSPANTQEAFVPIKANFR